jgi:predicted NAD/FAD-binding protein
MTCPNMMRWFEDLGVEVEASDMSFSASLRLDKVGGLEWGTRNGISCVLAQKSNLLCPRFWLVIREIIKFKNHALK